MRISQTAFVASSILLLTCSNAAGASSTITPIALSGEPAPGLVGIDFLLDPGPSVSDINESGQVAFQGGGAGVGVWIGEPDSVNLLIHTSNLSGAPAGLNINGWNYVQFGPNDDAMIHVRINSFGGGILFGPLGNLQLVARDGDDAPGTGPGVVFDKFFGMNQPSMAADARAVAFLANLAGDGVNPFVNDSGIWTGPVDGDLSLVARTGDPAIGFPDGINYQTLHPPTLNRDGAIAFIGMTSDFKYAVWAGTSSTIERILVGFEPVPGSPNTTVSEINNVGLDDQGHLKIVSEFFGSVSGWGILSGTPGDLQFIVHEGQEAPVGTEGSTASFWNLFGTPTLATGSGDIGFSAFLNSTEPDIQNQRGIWVANTDEVRLVAHNGLQVPGMPAGVVYTNINSIVHLNNSGMIVFESELTGPGIDESNDFGYFGGMISDVQLLVREGDVIETSPGVMQVIDHLPSLQPLVPNPNPQPMGNNANGNSMINDAGLFVFQASFPDEESPDGGVFILRLAAPLNLTWNVSEGELELSWPDDGTVLLSSESITGPWSPAASQQNPQNVPTSTRRQFFQLQR